MPLPVPNLDDRKFQDILDEARRLIPRYCPEWTDHNLSDPGITLLELFAWMTDMLLYRLNRVPEKNYLKFLDLIGVPRDGRRDVPPDGAAAAGRGDPAWDRSSNHSHRVSGGDPVCHGARPGHPRAAAALRDGEPWR
jgi:predicted phage baseplate assembly protein